MTSPTAITRGWGAGLRRALLPPLLILASLAAGWGLIQAGLLIAAGFGAKAGSGTARYEDVMLISKPAAVFDRVRGYRRVPGPVRAARIMRDELIYDGTVTPNNAGFLSARDYTYRKASSATVRLIVFGDSFSAAGFMGIPWPDRVHEALRRDGTEAPPVELYSFSLDGAGIANWHSIFFNEIVPNYDFDGVIIADYADDLSRAFSLLHFDGDKAYEARFPTQPADDADFFANYFPRMPRHPIKVIADAEMDRMIADLGGPWRWPGFALRAPALLEARWRVLVAQRQALARLAATATLVDRPELYSMAEMEQSYGARQFGFLLEMLAYCRARDIPVVLASIPTRDGARNVAATSGGAETAHEREVKSLAHHLKTLHFDGYRPFSVVAPEDVDRIYWLKYDGHWNQAGSDLFAAAMAPYLRQNIQVFQRAAPRPTP